MKLETLVAGVCLKDYKTFINTMNLKTDAIIINQTDKNSYEEIENENKKIKIYSFNERGVGINRNNALMRANADIVVFADDDVSYVDNYDEIIINEFKKNPKADMILFNLESLNPERPMRQILKRKRLNKLNFYRYGTVRIAVKLDVIRKNNIFFSLLFGGGAKYGSGEDTLFIRDCLKNHMKSYLCPVTIGTVKQETSSWFSGYDEKYLMDKGALYYCISRKFFLILCIQFLIRHKEILKKRGFKKSLKYMKNGREDYKKICN